MESTVPNHDSQPELHPISRYLAEKHVSQKTGIPIATLRKWRWQKSGIPYYKFGKSVRYLFADVDEWEKAQKVQTPQIQHSIPAP
jgi:predicted DNA-binding transcriptional regulator AlpA